MTAYDMPGDVLQRHAYNNVWCTPDQDLQIIFKPARISPINGQWYDFTHMWRKIALPTKADRYHIYQIGGINPELLGLETKINTWMLVPEVMQNKLVMIDTYTGNGFQIPRCLVYYRYTEDFNLIVAIRQPDKSIEGWNWEEDPPFIRLYSNAYFESLRSKSVSQYIGCISRRLVDRTAVQNFLNDVAAMPFTQGLKYFYVNGRYAPSVSLATIANGDYVDCIYDSSIKRVIDFQVKSLKEFNSKLDSLRKYLLHYQGTANTIDYQDDIDCFVYRSEGNFTRGVYLHKNDERTLRMVTHRDYALSVPVLNAAVTSSGIFKPDSVKVLRLHIRHSGYERPLIYENNRIHELYRLKEASLVKAMLGIDSVVPEWRADNLENSAYTALMRARPNTITREMVKAGYGYHAISKLIGDTPVKTQLYSGKTVCKVPVGLWGNSTAYEYDKDGLLLGWYYHSGGETYVCTNPGAKLVEMIYGRGGDTLDILDEVATGAIDFRNNYRFYFADKEFGISKQNWKPATDGMYLTTGTSFSWVQSPLRATRVLSNIRHLAYEFNYVPADGLLRFNVVRKLPNGQYLKLDMPLGELDIWLNRKKLIEKVDYLVKFPEVVIINTEYLNNGGVGEQNIAIRFKGFCKDDMTHYLEEETGFIVHNTVSHNFRYNVRNDHVVSVSVGGSVFHREDVRFAEDGVVPDALSKNNGKPYAVRNAVVPINTYIVDTFDRKDPTYDMLQQAIAADKRIEDYLSVNRPQATVPNVSMIPKRWRVCSPFFTKIITDLRDGILWEDDFTRHYGSEYVDKVIAPYLPLLETDLCREDGLYDPRYVVITPHPFGDYVLMDAYKHKFLRFVYKQYGRRVADLADFVGIIPFNI